MTIQRLAQALDDHPSLSEDQVNLRDTQETAAAHRWHGVQLRKMLQLLLSEATPPCNPTKDLGPKMVT